VGGPAEGAASVSISGYLASSAELEGVDGEFFSDESEVVEWPTAAIDQAARRLSAALIIAVSWR
jgi:hypothetical protein